MIRTVVVGAAGRMGRMLASRILRSDDLELSGAAERADSPSLGEDAGSLAGLSACGVCVTDSLESVLPGSDVVIDFSSPESTMAAAVSAVGAGCGMVIGTTGLDADQKVRLGELAEEGPGIVFAPNMSVGINLLFSLCARITPLLGRDYDIEVVEMHHNRKVDAPSGTAVRLGEILAKASGLDYSEDVKHGRRGRTGPRGDGEIGIHALRGGDVVGDHTVIFATEGERIEFTHRASSRETFVKGALRAVRFLKDAPPGLYDMQDVLGLK